MKVTIRGLPLVFAYAVSRSILKTNIGAPLHFFLLSVCLMQTCLCFLNPESTLYMIMKWFDPSLYVNPRTMTMIITGPNIIIGITILVQAVWAGLQHQIQTSLFKHYIIKISTICGLVMSYVLCLPILRCSFAHLYLSDITFQLISIFNIIVFLTTVYLYSMFLILDLSPHNQQIYAYLDFPNCFTIVNIYRLIASIIVSTTYKNLTIIPTIILLVVLTFWLVKYPIITWQYNLISQIFISVILWTIVCHIVGIVSQQHMQILAYVIGLPAFMGCSVWLLKKRVIYIVKKQKNDVDKLKIVYYMVYNFQYCQQQLDIFIMTHYRYCKSIQCWCHKILQQMSKQKIRNQQQENNQKQIQLKRTKKMRKTNKNLTEQQQNIKAHSKNLLFKQKQKQYWYELLCQLQNQQYMVQKIRQLSVTQKHVKINSAKEIIFDQTQILHYFLDKQYQALRNLWFCVDQINSNIIVPFFMLVRFTIQQYKQQQTIKIKSKQEGSNQYALNYYQFQTKLIYFRKLLLRSAVKIEYFWGQLATQQPDHHKIVNILAQILKSRRNILGQLKKYQGIDINNKEYEQTLYMNIKNVIQNVYKTYEIAINMNFLIKINQQSCDKLQKQSRKLEKNLVFYDSQAKTGMGVVNIQQGEQFGLITVTNKQFWELFNYERFQKPRINHFLVKQMHRYHDRTIINFLRQNKHFLSFHDGFVLDGNKLLVQIQFSVQLLPHVYDGLFAAVFIQEAKSQRSIFLTDRASNIISYNKRFKQKFLSSNNLRQFDQIINKEVLAKLQTDKKCIVAIDGQDYLIKNNHQIFTQTEEQDLYFCEIYQQWDDIPFKTVAIQEQEKSEFYHRNDNVKTSKTQQTLQRKKIQKQSIQYLFTIIRNSKVSSKLKRWKIFIIICSIITLMLAIMCSGFTQLRANCFLSANKIFSSNSELTQHIIQSTYTVRRISNLNYNNQSGEVPKYLNTLKKIKDQILQQKTETVLGLWPIQYLSYQINQNDKISLANTNYQMLIQKFILSSYSTIVSNVNAVNFNYIKSQINLPYNGIYMNFLSAIYNTYYVIIPKVTKQFKQQFKKYLKNKVTFPVPIVPLSTTIIFIQLVIIFVSIYFRLKLLNLLDTSIKLIQGLNISYVQNRLKIIKGYTRTNLTDLQQYNKLKQKQLRRQQLTNGKTKLLNNTNKLRKLTILNKPQMTIDNLNSTARDLTQTPRDKQKQQKNLQISKEKVALRAQKLPKHKIILIILIGIFPIIALECTIVSIQAYYNKFFWRALTLQDNYHQKSENIKYIKSLSYEIGYETDNFKSQKLSIRSQVVSTLQNIYVLERKIQQMQNQDRSSFTQEIKKLNRQVFCSILDYFYQNQDSIVCSQQIKQKYANKYYNQILVEYIETARSLCNQYSDLNLSSSKQRAFFNDPRHIYLQQIDQYIGQIEKSVMKRFQFYYKDKVKVYQITIIGFSLCAIPLLILLKVCWFNHQLKQIQFQMQQIKVIIQLLSQNQINSNAELKKQVLNYQGIFNILI